MTLAAIRGLDQAPTRNRKLLAWVRDVAELTQPDQVYWCDGSEEEWTFLTEALVQAGTLKPLNPVKRPNSFYAASDPKDVARVESRTFICSRREIDAGPTNNWADPAEMRTTLNGLFKGAMRGRTMYVIPFCMGPIGSRISAYGVEISDSAYVAVSMRIMTRMGAAALEGSWRTDGVYRPLRCIRSAPPLARGRPAMWRGRATRPRMSMSSIIPETREIWSFGSGYGGNALARQEVPTRCASLSVMARDEGWLAEHMLDAEADLALRVRRKYVAGAFPSACGKTNMAMLQPTIAGWTAETIGDDIAWMRFGDDGRLYAINPEYGFFGVAPGTGEKTNKNAIDSLTGNCIFTNVALTDDGDVWWEGMTEQPPEHLTDWRGRDWTPASSEPAAHPNARFTVPAGQCPTIAAEWEDPQGVPISAILFGGRRATAVPLVTEAFDWNHGVFLASNVASEGTAAAENKLGALRRDPFAMLPFCGYNMADYFAHWLNMGEKAPADRLPRIYFVNWFRKDEHGRFVWPGYGDNARVLKWIVERLEGQAEAHDTPIGRLPTPASLDTSGLDLSEAQLHLLLSVDRSVWREEAAAIPGAYERFGERLPAALWAQHEALVQRLNA